MAPTAATARRAALEAAGDGAALSHRTAAELWDLRGVRSTSTELTVTRRGIPRLRGVVVHRTNRLDPVDVASLGGLAVTSPARTLIDLGAVLPSRSVLLAGEDALVRDLVDLDALADVLDRLGGKGRPGVRALRRVLELHVPGAAVESRLEAATWALIRRPVCRCPPASTSFD